MRIHTRTVVDIKTGLVLEDHAYEYNGPIAKADRAAQAAATNATNQAAGTGAQLSQNAQGIYGPLTSFANSEIAAPPGYGTALPGMESTAGQIGNAVSAGQQQEAQTRAANTRNAAGLSANQDAIAQAASRGTGQNIEGILAGNEQEKLQQQQQGAGILSGIYGTDVGGANSAYGQQANDINAQVNAGKVGWLQNLGGILGSLGQLGSGVGSAATGLSKL